MRVEVVYALPRHAARVELDLAPGATVADAITASGLAERFGELDAERGPFGVFATRCGPDRILRAGDRVEIYRPLEVEPGEARRRRAR